MNNTTWLDLESFIRKEAGIRASRPIRPSDRLEQDLDLTGDEADDFMGKFFDRFPVGHGDYAFSRYFCEEGFNLFAILAMPFSKNRRRKYEKESLTVGMLQRAIDIGEWDSKRLTD